MLLGTDPSTQPHNNNTHAFSISLCVRLLIGDREVYCSAYRYAPEESLNASTRTFGMGYYETSMPLSPSLTITHFIYAPYKFAMCISVPVRYCISASLNLRLSVLERQVRRRPSFD
jgi:hypothetical protein